jgi:HSP20 family protein
MRRNPFGAIDPLASRMWDWITTPAGFTPMGKLFGETDTFVPPVDIYETGEEIVVAASLPGLDVSKIDIQVREDHLTLAGEQSPVVCFDASENATAVFNGIPRYGKFSFGFRLPCAVDTQNTQAKYENGLLCMRFLKAQSARTVRISVQSGAQHQIAASDNNSAVPEAAAEKK